MRPQPLSRKLPQQRDRARLVLNFINLGQPSLALEYATKAYQLRTGPMNGRNYESLGLILRPRENSTRRRRPTNSGQQTGQ